MDPTTAVPVDLSSSLAPSSPRFSTVSVCRKIKHQSGCVENLSGNHLNPSRYVDCPFVCLAVFDGLVVDYLFGCLNFV